MTGRAGRMLMLIPLLGGAWLACGGTQLSTSGVGDVQAAMRAAEEVGAKDQPKASLHLQLAQDEVNEAQRLADEGDEENAALLLYRARVDAELALQLARTDQEQQKARQAWERVKDVQKEQR
jgi:hypothetical protein